MSSELESIVHQCPHCSVLLDVSEQEPFTEIHCPSCDVSMRVRTRFDHFELTEAIASGGMGTVYRARDVNLNRIVALKLLRREFSADQDYIEKLETEAKITASVNHPYVVKVFSFGSDHGQYYIAMELVDKGSLDDLMNLQGRIAEAQVLEIGAQVAAGLNAAYQAGLIHRDVKPGNILFADAHTAKIVDFGLALPLEQAQEETGGEIWGTPYYVAPEKLNHDPEDFRSDIYSLGGTLFHALAGRPPFEAENASLVALKHLKSNAVSLQAFAPDISGPTAYVINRTLAKNPDDRYQSYDELIEHLEYARAQLLENSGKPRQPKARVVLEGAEQQEAFGYINMAIIAFVVVLGIVLFLFKDKIISHRLSAQELEERRVEKGASATDQLYRTARKALIAREKDASKTFQQLEERPNTPQPLKNWVTLMSGIASYMENKTGPARSAFGRIQSAGMFSIQSEDRKLAGFFLDVARVMSGEKPVNPTSGQQFMTTDYGPLAIYAFALKDWSINQFDDAASLFQAFLSTTPKGDWKWIEEFQPVAKLYLADYDAYMALSTKIAASSTPDEKKALILEAEHLKKNLHLPGRMSDKLASVISELKGNPPSSPGDWKSADIGDVGLAGQTEISNGKFTVAASGKDIFAGADQFRFVSRKFSANGQIVARLIFAQDNAQKSKAGIMIRESQNADSRHMGIFLVRDGIEVIFRDKWGGESRSILIESQQAPVTLKLVRSEDRFAAYYSKDGDNWTQAGGSETIRMNTEVFAGLAVSSHDNKALKTAIFDRVILGH